MIPANQTKLLQLSLEREWLTRKQEALTEEISVSPLGIVLLAACLIPGRSRPPKGRDGQARRV